MEDITNSNCTHREVLKLKGGYCFLAELSSNMSFREMPESKVLEHFINYLLAQEVVDELGLIEHYGHTDVRRDNLCYGFYEATELESIDYKPFDRKRLMFTIEASLKTFSDEIADSFERISSLLTSYLAQNVLIFHLNIDKGKHPEKLSNWTVHNSFEAFLLVNMSENKIIVLDIGSD